MAKGLAVISGSQAVIFKALESGVVQMGNSGSWGEKLAQVTISGSLNISGSAGVKLKVEGSEFRIDNLSGLADQVIISGASDSVTDFGNQDDEYGSLGASKIRDSSYELKGGLKYAATSSAPAGALEDKTSDATAYYNALEGEGAAEAPEDFLVITEDGELRRVNKIDASVVMLNDGQTVEQQVGGLNLNLKHSASDGTIDEKDVNLTKGDLIFKDVQYRTVLSMSNDDNGESVEVKVDLDPDLRVETLSASAGLTVTGSSDLRGKVHVVGAESDLEVDRNLDVHGAATVDGDMTIKGDLTVWGDTTVTTADSKHLKVEDSIIQIGFDQVTGSESASNIDPADFDLGFVFGTANQKALVLKDGVLHFGDTLNSAGDSEITVTASAIDQGKMVLSDLSASQGIDALDLRVHNSATITGKLDANADVDLGASAADQVKIFGTLTASAEALFEDHVTISGDAKSNLTISNGDLTVVGSGSFTGDLNVDGTGSFGQSVTLRAGADLTLDQGNATLTDGDLTISGSALISASAGNALHIENGDILSNKGDLTLEDGNLAVTGSTTLSASAESNALDVASGDVTIRDNLTVEQGVVTLGTDLAQGVLNVAGEWTQSAQLDVKGALNVSGSVLLGHVDADRDSHSRVVVNGEFRIPKFTRDQIPTDYTANPADYEGYMFYLMGEHDDSDPYFPRARKWYFNEGGVWHSSFFWDDQVDLDALDGDPNT